MLEEEAAAGQFRGVPPGGATDLSAIGAAVQEAGFLGDAVLEHGMKRPPPSPIGA